MIVAIASGKGGVGKTWFAITLAQALTSFGGSVLLVDGDTGLANVDVQLGFAPARDIADVLAGNASLLAVAHATEAGFDVVAGRSGSGALATTEASAILVLIERLREASSLRNYVIVDLGAGLDAGVRRLAACADLLLVVATDEPTSLTDAYAVLKLYASDRAPRPNAARLVVNQAASAAAGARTADTLRKACSRFLGAAPPLAGVIRRDTHVGEAIRRQMPLLTRHPASPAAADVEAIARTVACCGDATASRQP